MAALSFLPFAPLTPLPFPAAARRFEPRSVPVEGGIAEVKLASEPDEWEQAFQLVATNYQNVGYEINTAKAYRFTSYHALSDTAVFVAKRAGKVLATFSLVADNDLLGLPMEALYGDEVAAMRRQGRRLAEVTSLAADNLGTREFLPVFMTMIRVMGQYHLAQGGDTWVITVNPRHRAFYGRVIGAEPMGGRKAYAAVGDAPAEAYWFDQPIIKARTPKTFDFLFGERLPSDCLRKPALPRPFIHFFGSESTQADEVKLNLALRAASEGRKVRRW